MATPILTKEDKIVRRFRGTPAHGLVSLGSEGKTVVDKEARVIRGVSLFQAGVEALGHGIQGDDITLAMLKELGNQRPNGVKSRFGHPGMSESAIGKQLAQARNHRVVNDKLIADLHLLDSARLSPSFANDPTDWLLSMAEEAPEDFGMSIVFSADLVWRLDDGTEVGYWDADVRPENATTEFPVIRPTSLNAADVVDTPAANRDGMFTSFSTGPDVDKARHMFDQIDGWLVETGVSAQKAYEFASRYFHARGVTGKPMHVAGSGDDHTENQVMENENTTPAEEQELHAGVEQPEVENDAVEQEAAPNQLEQLAGALGLETVFSQIAEQFEIRDELLNEQSARMDQLEAQLAELSVQLADKELQLSRAEGFPVVEEPVQASQMNYHTLFTRKRDIFANKAEQAAPATQEAPAELSKPVVAPKRRDNNNIRQTQERGNRFLNLTS